MRLKGVRVGPFELLFLSLVGVLETAVDKERRTIVMNDSVSLQTLEEMKQYYQACGSEYDAIINH